MFVYLIAVSGGGFVSEDVNSVVEGEDRALRFRNWRAAHDTALTLAGVTEGLSFEVFVTAAV